MWGYSFAVAAGLWRPVLSVRLNSRSTLSPRTNALGPRGTLLTGQDGWYNPIRRQQRLQRIHLRWKTRSASSPTPNGGTQMIAGVCPGGTAFARGPAPIRLQRRRRVDCLVGMWVGHVQWHASRRWKTSASFSLQPSTTKPLLAAAHELGARTARDAHALRHQLRRLRHDRPHQSRSSPPARHGWVCRSTTGTTRTTTWSFETNLVTEVTITTDPSTGGVTDTTAHPAGWYLAGGPQLPAPPSPPTSASSPAVSGRKQRQTSRRGTTSRFGRPSRATAGNGRLQLRMATIGTDADLSQASSPACRAPCPAAPVHQQRRLQRRDGDLGTDADIEAFFRVLSGGPLLSIEPLKVFKRGGHPAARLANLGGLASVSGDAHEPNELQAPQTRSHTTTRIVSRRALRCVGSVLATGESLQAAGGRQALLRAFSGRSTGVFYETQFSVRACRRPFGSKYGPPKHN